jgi:hypothetical protein
MRLDVFAVVHGQILIFMYGGFMIMLCILRIVIVFYENLGVFANYTCVVVDLV